MKINHVENTYLVCFDFNKLRERFNPNDKYNSVIAVEFMTDCYFLKDKLIELFPNFTIPLSNNSFLIKTRLQSGKLLDLLVKALSDKFFGIKDGDSIKKQIYAGKITSLESYTHRTKQFEIDYLNNAICKRL